MKKARLSLALAMVLLLAGCIPKSGTSREPLSTPTSAVSQLSEESQVDSVRSTALDEYQDEILQMVNRTLSDYAAGSFPEPVRYNSDDIGISNAAPPDVELPSVVGRSDVAYQYKMGQYTDTIVATVELENDYNMVIYMATETGTGKPTRPTGVFFYDTKGVKEKSSVPATRGGEFMYLKSDRLYASADFSQIRTDAGLVSGSITWSKANKFLWVNVDSMKEPFFYTYFITPEGGLVQDYPQKEWQRYDVIHDDKMMVIAQSLFDQFHTAVQNVAAPDSSSSKPK